MVELHSRKEEKEKKEEIIEGGIHTKRIARNSLVLFLRMLALMLISLYSVKVVIARLGIEDYGVFHAVAGVATTLTCLSSVLAVSTQRFYSFLAGQRQYHKLKQVFSISVNINIGASVLTLLIFETLALWFVNTYLNIPPGREFAANILFQCSLFAFIFNLLQIPFTAAIIAHEQMGYYALVSFVDCLLKLVAALLIGTARIDNLIFYGIALLVVAILVFALYTFIAIRHYPECRYVKVRSIKAHRELLSFSGWVMFGSLANVGLVQGNIILLNLFFGPIINAAFAISQQIYNAFNSLTNSVVVAVRPTMNRLYAEGDTPSLLRMFYTTNKILAFAVLLVAIPLSFEMGSILRMWLSESVANERTVLYCRLMIVYFAVIVLNNPITILMQSAGKLKYYHLRVESVTLLSIPLTLLIFLLHAPDYSVYFSMIALAFIAHQVRLQCLGRCYHDYSTAQYLRSFLTPSIIIATATIVAMYALHTLLTASLLRLLLSCMLSAVLVPVLALLVGLNAQEKQQVISLVKKGAKSV